MSDTSIITAFADLTLKVDAQNRSLEDALAQIKVLRGQLERLATPEGLADFRREVQELKQLILQSRSPRTPIGTTRIPGRPRGSQ